MKNLCIFKENAIKIVSVTLIFYSVILVRNSYAQTSCISISEIDFKSKSTLKVNQLIYTDKLKIVQMNI